MCISDRSRSAPETPHASPYSIADYNEIDPECGTARDLHDFVDAAHKLHLKVMLDIVYYHAAPDNILLKQDAEMFVKTPDGAVARGFWPQPLPDFWQPESAEIPERQSGALGGGTLAWMGSVAMFGAGVPVSFWNEARKALDGVNPEVILLSESDRPDDQLQAFDINYNFQYYLTLVSVLRDGAPALKLREQWETMNSNLPHGARVLHYSDNHDWPRAVLQFGKKGAMAASVLNFTLDGIPFLWNGQEVDDATPTSWRKPAPIHWLDHESGVEQKTIEPDFEMYKRLFAVRATEPALMSGSVVWINNTEPASVLSFLRKEGNSEVLVILNLSNRQVHVTIDLPVMDYYAIQNLLKPDKTWFQLYSGRVSADLGAFEYVVGKKIPLCTAWSWALRRHTHPVNGKIS